MLSSRARKSQIEIQTFHLTLSKDMPPKIMQSLERVRFKTEGLNVEKDWLHSTIGHERGCDVSVPDMGGTRYGQLNKD
eukprot:2126907-Amphidinium_carterae.1